MHISTLSVILSFMKFCVARTFLVERHLDVVLEVPLVVGSKLIFYKTCRYIKSRMIAFKNVENLKSENKQT